MKSVLSKTVKSEFHQRMRTFLPSFQKVETDFGGVIYRRPQEIGGKYIFIFLSPSPKFDRFTIELASSSEPTFPFDLLPGDKTPLGTARERIRKFLPGGTDGWWNLNRSHEPEMGAVIESLGDTHKSASTIPALVADAVEQIQQALPRFLESLEKQNKRDIS